ncbi:hypothetical protein AG1IA_10266 [Rhizoctonia solani AG-1 IA]|uniref:Uncharacterized protein n=1 Tax=Thanatephorus cucumeris (strain AG1-IA) TaxID=983506 RepID=L8WH45_THACA|nr:hypothetical protein AG1IA_10266 [Rhizoctonia solani AG-1 IA]
MRSFTLCRTKAALPVADQIIDELGSKSEDVIRRVKVEEGSKMILGVGHRFDLCCWGSVTMPGAGLRDTRSS